MRLLKIKMAQWFALLCLLSFSVFAQDIPEIKKLEYSDEVLNFRKEMKANLVKVKNNEEIKLTWIRYRLKEGENFFIVMKYLSTDHDTLISVNRLITVWDYSEGDEWLIPSIRGVAEKEKPEVLARRFNVPVETLIPVPGRKGMYFVPDVKIPKAERDFMTLRAFIRPVDAPMSSPFGVRIDPFTDKRRMHKGIDLAAPIGTKVKASAKGTVSFTGIKGGYGKVVILNHGNGYQTIYGHLNSFLVKKGDKVRQGDFIARSGNTGRSTGPHLHFEVIRDGSPQKPDFTHKRR
jgi:hypothetical protein